ncbi:lipopolysaccharide transport periplasmic protein LptA [Geobacter pickeringii]|uniref:Sugar ABC transporter substrate-binding protein n=1 Tax=Geobacter pickeringii TaxID=345632 RepID=A0A0B5BD38_9BACT|nr:lipopolysaccharide transport periplasmic protein LptA [Geobacter pickeringii]AJE03004.1 sugar ABC transporter substrate-binding protein [Geobacter pickeringii]
MKRFLCAFSLLFVLGGSALAAPPAGERGKEPITIKSNELSTDSKSRTATFTGKVTARQGDLTIYADRLVVHYKQEGGDVDRVDAIGNVRIVQGDRLATAREGVYLSAEQKIVLSGDPKVFQGENTVSGKVITYFVNEEKSVVTGGPDGRVEAVIHPKNKAGDGGSKR